MAEGRGCFCVGGASFLSGGGGGLPMGALVLMGGGSQETWDDPCYVISFTYFSYMSIRLCDSITCP